MQGWPEGLGASPKRLLDTPSARAMPAVLGWTPASQGPSRQPPGPGATPGPGWDLRLRLLQSQLLWVSVGRNLQLISAQLRPGHVPVTASEKRGRRQHLGGRRNRDQPHLQGRCPQLWPQHRVGAAGSKGTSLGDPLRWGCTGAPGPPRPVPAARTRRPHAGTPPLTAGRGVTHTLTQPPRAPTLLLPRPRPRAGNWPAGLSSHGHCHKSTGACVSSAFVEQMKHCSVVPSR